MSIRVKEIMWSETTDGLYHELTGTIRGEKLFVIYQNYNTIVISHLNGSGEHNGLFDSIEDAKIYCVKKLEEYVSMLQKKLNLLT